MTTEFTAYYSMAQNFAALAACGDVMTGTTLVHQGQIIARMIDGRKMAVTSAKLRTPASDGLRGVLVHVAKRSGLAIVERELA